MKNQAPVKQEKHDTTMMKIIFSVIIMIVAFLAALYVMIRSGDPIYVMIFGIVIIAGAFFLITTLIQANYQRQLRQEERYENIFKSEKASYMLLRSNFEHLSQRVNEVDQKMTAYAQALAKDQRGYAKITVNRNKENADALLASNDQVLLELTQLGDNLGKLEDNVVAGIAAKNVDQLRIANQDILAKDQEILSQIKMVDLSIRNSILELKSVMNSAPQTTLIQGVATPTPIPTPQPAPTPIAAEAAMPEMVAEPMPEPVMPEMAVEPVMPEIVPEPVAEAAPEPMVEPIAEAAPEPVVEAVPEPEPVIETAPEPTPEPVPEPEPVVEAAPEQAPAPEPEKPPMPDLSDPNHVMTPDEIAALLANTAGDSAPAPAPEPEPVVEAAPEPEPVVEAAPEPAPAPEPEKPPMPDLSDPNHVMTPDEIAALLANTAGDSTPSPEPAPAPEPEKPPMPDLSDPNHVMTPDEIAALLANTAGDSAPALEPASAPEPEKPPMPDLSDPNHVMTPEEIAALIANS